ARGKVAIEATGVYWKPVWAVLEDRFRCLLVNARYVNKSPVARPMGPKRSGSVRSSSSSSCPTTPLAQARRSAVHRPVEAQFTGLRSGIFEDQPRPARPTRELADGGLPERVW